MGFLDQYSSPPPHFLCPRLRFLKQMDPETYFIEIDPSLRELSSHKIYFIRMGSFSCSACKHRTDHLCDAWCFKCSLSYHKECVESPPEIKVPYHPKHPLQLLFPSSNGTLHVGSSHYNKCNCCGENTEGFYYSCSICDFKLHPPCAISLDNLSINYPKRHEHTLTYFPRKNSLTCDVCASGDDKCFIYICLQCDFVVHRTCIYLPNTIRISRHHHRISFTSLYILNKNLSCGVCRKMVDKEYGRYSCVNDCDYVVHSKCATRKDLWDGQERDVEPETEYEEIKAFKEIEEGVISHISHPYHYITLIKKENNTVDEGKMCQACILPIYERNIYGCFLCYCNFIIHETCAHLPRKKWHPLHAHPLTLQVAEKHRFETKFVCVACRNHCCGFSYTCPEEHCSFSLDVRCALVSEPFTHELHPHPLFLTFEQGISTTCSMCGNQRKHLNCIECSFVFCFRCATLPYKMKYKHDEHYLALSYKEDTEGFNWCDICERETYPHVGFYTCNSLCSITVHIDCLLGVDPFMNNVQRFKINQVSVWTISNNGLTREICMGCRNHCHYRIAYEAYIERNRTVIFCSLECIYSVLELPKNSS